MELKGLDFTIHELTLCMTPPEVSKICEGQKKDATMQLIIQQLLQGWSHYHKEVDQGDDLSIEDGCIAYLGRLIIHN